MQHLMCPFDPYVCPRMPLENGKALIALVDQKLWSKTVLELFFSLSK